MQHQPPFHHTTPLKAKVQSPPSPPPTSLPCLSPNTNNHRALLPASLPTSFLPEVQRVDRNMSLQRVFVHSNAAGMVKKVAELCKESSVAAVRNVEVCALTPETYDSCDILLGDPPILPGIVPKLTSLKWLQSSFAGVNHLMAPELPKNYLLTRIKGIFGPDMAAYVLGQVVAVTRRFEEMREDQGKHHWDTRKFEYPSLSDMTLGVLGGGGDIALSVLKAASAVGMSTIGLVSSPTKECVADTSTSSLETLLKAADVVVNLLPSTPSTVGALSGDVLAAAKEKRPIFINVGRGDIIDEASILRALEEGWISWAVLDVFAKEPLPDTSKLWDHPRITITPHVAAMTKASTTAKIFVDNLERYVNDEKLSYVVDWEKGY